MMTTTTMRLAPNVGTDGWIVKRNTHEKPGQSTHPSKESQTARVDPRFSKLSFQTFKLLPPFVVKNNSNSNNNHNDDNDDNDDDDDDECLGWTKWALISWEFQNRFLNDKPEFRGRNKTWPIFPPSFIRRKPCSAGHRLRHLRRRTLDWREGELLIGGGVDGREGAVV